jgi:hypothetical protein
VDGGGIVSAEHTGKSGEAARFKAEVTRLVEQGYTMDEVARIFRIRNGRQREAFKRKYAPPAVPAPPPVALGPAVPPEGCEGQRPGSATRIVNYRKVAERVYEIVMESIAYGQESITYGRRTRRVLVLPESALKAASEESST